MFDKFSKMIYIKNKKKILENDLYIGLEGVIFILIYNFFLLKSTILVANNFYPFLDSNISLL